MQKRAQVHFRMLSTKCVYKSYLCIKWIRHLITHNGWYAIKHYIPNQIYIYIYIYTHTHTHTHTLSLLYIYIYIYIYINIYICVCVYVFLDQSCFNQRRAISILNCSPLKLVDTFTYIICVSSTERYINIRLAKAWTVSVKNKELRL